MNIEELKRLAEAATPGPWYDRAGVLRGTGGGIKPIATIYNGLNSPYIAAANPAAVLELIAEVEALRANATGLEHQLRESRQNDYHAMSYLADCRFAVGDDGKRMLPEFVEHLRALKQQRDELLAALKRIKANLMHQRLCGQSAGLLHAAIQAEGDAEEVIAKMEG
jgi:hypothetical protein